MADNDNATNGDLKVTFSREGAAEEVYVCRDGEAALMAGMRLLMQQDALRDGDVLMVQTHQRKTLTERGLA
jgi:hypothetical protein